MTGTEKKETPREIRNRKLGELLVSNYTRNGFEAYYVETGEEAKDLAVSLIDKENEVVSWGGVTTAEHIGLMEVLRSGEYKVIDRDTAKSPEERWEIMRQALLCDTFIASPNGFSEDGQMIFIDGNGNRVGAISFGPSKVILLASLSKYNKTFEGAMNRAQHYAAPVNTMRFLPALETPCAITGSCGNCRGDKSACTFLLKIRHVGAVGRIKVIFIGETVGF